MTSALALSRRITADEFLDMENKGYELVEGELEELRVGAESSLVGKNLIVRMELWVGASSLGLVFPSETGFWLAPTVVRKPDGMFYAAGRLPGNRAPKGWIDVAPDLAFEVISPRDLAHRLNQKLDEYLAAGVRLVWVIDPELRKAQVWRPGEPVRILGEQDVLDGEDVLPGFGCLLREILPDPDPLQVDG